MKIQRKNKKSNTPYQRNLDTMKLLVSYVEFQDLVSKMRKKLGVPDNGFSRKDPALKTWHNNLLTESDKILSSRSFRQQEEKIHRNPTEEKIGVRTATKQMHLLFEKAPINYLHYRISFILDAFHLPLNFREHIENYIIHGEVNAPSRNYKIGPYQPFESPRDARYVPVTIYGQLDQREVKELKKEIDRWHKRNIPKFNPIKDVGTRLELEEWFENRERFDDGTGDSYNTSNIEIAETIFGNKRKNKQVSDMYRSTKKLREKRFRFGKK